jgi:hypothetical protein
MATLLIGNIGERMDLLIRQGATFGPFTATMKNPDESPVNLTGCLIRGQIRRKPADSVIAATVEVTSPYDATGAYVFGLPSAVTAAIQCGADTSAPTSLYHWDLEMVDSQGLVHPLYWGEVRVHREVTRAQ